VWFRLVSSVVAISLINDGMVWFSITRNLVTPASTSHNGRQRPEAGGGGGLNVVKRPFHQHSGGLGRRLEEDGNEDGGPGAALEAGAALGANGVNY